MTEFQLNYNKNNIVCQYFGGKNMTIEEIKHQIITPEYNFLYSNENLGENLILLGLGGSYAYGTNNENSDLDVRGIAVNSKRNILLGQDFEQVVETTTDTTIYSFDKIIKLLCNCNPNTIEILGLKPEHYLYLSPIGRLLLDNKRLFLSKVASYAFGGYANSQLRRLENKSARMISQAHEERNILKSIEHAEVTFKDRYLPHPNDAFRLYVDKSSKAEYDEEIFIDANITHYPLRDFNGIIQESNAIIKAYTKMSSRSKKAIEHDKLGKHMMHLVRLYLMCFDILEKGEINTYRADEHDFLMGIRNGKYLKNGKEVLPEFYDMVDEFEKRLQYAQQNTDLPDTVDMKKIGDLVYTVNDMICKQEG